MAFELFYNKPRVITRCDELERKLRYMGAEINVFGLSVMYVNVLDNTKIVSHNLTIIVPGRRVK